MTSEYQIEIRPLALFEIKDAFDWYEAQRDGLGYEFLEEIDAFYLQLKQNPYTYSYFDKPVRQGIIGRFPYCIIYEITEMSIVIYSVFMTKQDPAKKRTK